MKNFQKVLFTCGDINGISPEISLKLFNYLLSKNKKHHLIFICPKNVFKIYYKNLQLKFKYKFIKDVNEFEEDLLNVLAMPDAQIDLGNPTKTSGKVSFESLMLSIDILKKKYSSIVITSPVSKLAINKAGINFIGQTELLANEFDTQNFLMMFLSKEIKAALNSIHIPIKDVANQVNNSSMNKKLNLLHSTLKKDFNIQEPKIAVLGLNPHAGENGRIGDEEVKIISKVIKKFSYLSGPFVPDAFFANKIYKNFDAVFGMYHDQILIPFKMLSFHTGVNFTAGLPIIRTSPDHGTAFDIAGKNRANFRSIYYAYKYAIQISKLRSKVER